MALDNKKSDRVRAILDDPDLFPDEFKSWIPRFIEGNPNLQLGALQLPATEAIRYVGASGEAVFANSWVNYVAGFEEAGYYKDLGGRIHVSGLIKLGTIGTVAFVLPGGYRPRARMIFTGVDGVGSSQRLDVLATGDVVPMAGNNAYFSLSQINFRAYG